MSQQLHHAKFDINELSKVEPPANPVILKSGGPIMNVVDFVRGLAVCEWEDGRASFPPDCLYRLSKFGPPH